MHLISDFIFVLARLLLFCTRRGCYPSHVSFISYEAKKILAEIWPKF